MKGKIILTLLLILLPLSAKAYTCGYNEQADLRKMASNIQTSYDYYEYEGNAYFNVTLTNMNDRLYVVDTTTGRYYYYNGTSEITINGYPASSNIKYKIYPTKANCMSSYLVIKYVNLPDYNKYYLDPLCEGKNYAICNKWSRNTLTYEEFTKKINELDKKNIPEEKEKKEEKNIFDYVMTFIYKYYVLIMIILVGTFIIIELEQRKRNSVKW